MSLTMDLQLYRDNFSLSITTQLPAMGYSAIYGHSGAGKTTLLRWLAGLEKNTRGKLYFKKQCWQDRNVFLPTQQREIGYVFQDARLFPHLTVKENLYYAYKRRFNDNGPSMDQACSWFELQTLLTRYPDQLSGGQKQRVAIARSLLSSPQLILMDEPLASLDTKSKEHILQHLEQLHKTLEIPVIYISHDLEEVGRLADQLILLDNGKVRAQGDFLELSSQLSLSLTHEENSASIIKATVDNHDEFYHLTELSIHTSQTQKQSIFLTKNTNQPGEKVRVRIPARDVSIALSRTNDSSILNILACTIDAIENTNDARVLIRLTLGKQYLIARLTHKSIDRLELKVGQNVFAQIKTVALLSEQSNDKLTK